MKNILFIIETIKDIQCIDLFIGLSEELNEKNQTITLAVGPLNKVLLSKSKTIKKCILGTFN